MESEARAAHQALETVWARLYAQFDGARFERRGDLILALYPPVPIAQCNGAWVVEDTEAAARGLADVLAEVDATGARPWVQTRSGHERTQRASAELGLTYRAVVPGMVLRPEELASPAGDGLEIDLVAQEDIAVATGVLAASFGAPVELFEVFSAACLAIEEVSWYTGRADGEIVATALAVTIDDVTGIFNVGTLPEHRGRGHGAALTARAVRDGFDGGATLAFLQSSDIGHGVYRRLGFRDVEEYVLLTRPPD